MTNSSLLVVIQELEAMRDDLRARMNVTSVPEDSDRLFLQIMEIGHRLQMLHALLFRDAVVAIDDEVGRIQSATKDVRAAVEQQEAVAAVVNGVKSVLGIVDSVIDLLS
jgi:hypothetical protein